MVRLSSPTIRVLRWSSEFAGLDGKLQEFHYEKIGVGTHTSEVMILHGTFHSQRSILAYMVAGVFSLWNVWPLEDIRELGVSDNCFCLPRCVSFRSSVRW